MGPSVHHTASMLNYKILLFGCLTVMFAAVYLSEGASEENKPPGKKEDDAAKDKKTTVEETTEMKKADMKTTEMPSTKNDTKKMNGTDSSASHIISGIFLITASSIIGAAL